jgi:Tfp pilus assembly protein PilZ
VADNRRTQTRHDVSIAAKLTVDGATIDCNVLNLSLGGALVSASKRYTMAQRVSIAFAVPTMEEKIEIGATVRWASSDGVGIQFDGLRARDVWALNEFFKQLSSS